GAGILLYPSPFPRPPSFSRGQVQDPRAACPVKKDAVGPDELQRVPLDRVVTRRDRDAAARAVVQDGELNGGGGRETDINHRATGPSQSRDHGFGEAGPRLAGIAADNDGRS